ncbi:MAG: hypoxanthine phosphoribosyltransferase [Defluviitaleaceae bacterium]|nr:hypoxanthine phosphoribosyltransferase [Defluviitaleaceae bacterium]MCL2836894.1 hypoxanthine phosphoribosyltransferase [Defluviitaleaceae bacterium]
MGEKIITLISQESIEKRIAELAKQIAADYDGKNLFIICGLKGAFIFASDLMKLLPAETEIGFMGVSSYGKGMKSSAQMELVLDLQDSIEDRHVLLVEDIADTGRSISFFKKQLAGRGYASLKLCTLLDKPDARVVEDVLPDYIGFSIENKFVVGYGLDFAQKYRGLPYVGYLTFDD